MGYIPVHGVAFCGSTNINSDLATLVPKSYSICLRPVRTVVLLDETPVDGGLGFSTLLLFGLRGILF